ncbi:MAG: alpha/beta fold hydrolase, partial [Pseudomonadota bacterium]
MRLVATGAADINCLQIIPQAEHKQPADIVFVHGLATNMAFWYASIAMAFSSVARVTLIDLRGHGRSSTPPSGYRAPDLAADAVDVV